MELAKDSECLPDLLRWVLPLPCRLLGQVKFLKLLSHAVDSQGPFQVLCQDECRREGCVVIQGKLSGHGQGNQIVPSCCCLFCCISGVRPPGISFSLLSGCDMTLIYLQVPPVILLLTKPRVSP